MTQGLGPDPNTLQTHPVIMQSNGPLNGVSIPQASNPYEGYSPQINQSHASLIIVIVILIVIIIGTIYILKLSRKS
ncbi:MAG TPA: hypothetical protein VG964_01510 [Candidatus Saccharimonadales bacterium]|nr:hypothetical protein [Candidatus Saccharimonadales bacterium]